MNAVQLIVVAVGLINTAVGRTIPEAYLDLEFRLCGQQLYAMLGRICNTHRYDPEAMYNPAVIAQTGPSIHTVCCQNKCKVKEVIMNFCPEKSIQSIPNAVNTMRTPTTTKRTIKAPVELIGSRVTTTTEKLASIWFLTG